MAQQQSGQPVGGKSNEKKFPWTRLIITILIIVGILMIILWQLGVFSPKGAGTLSVKEINDKIGNGFAVKEWHVDEYNNAVYITLGKQVGTGWSGVSDYKIIMANSQISNMFEFVDGTVVKPGTTPSALATMATALSKGIHVSDALRPKQSYWLGLLSSFLPMLIFILIMFFIFRRMSGARGGGMSEVFSGGKNQARKIVSKVRFSDVAGLEEVKEEVTEVVDFLKKPSKYRQAGARIPKGILLSGPPGTGKTLIAKAVAGEAGVPFYFISASNFVEMFAGLGAKRVREMFKDARRSAPAILFIDELDAIGRKRGTSLSGNDEREQTLNQILVEMDGMDENSGLLIVAATNRPDVLDPALLRPGRFDRKITVGLPDILEREAILRLHAKGKRISSEVDFKNIAKRIPRFSGAQIENVVNEAALLSVREKTDVITLPQIDEAIDRVNAGPAKKHRVITPEENRMVAVHEAGHAVTGLKVPGADIVQKITIIPRGDAGGYTLRVPKKEKYTQNKTELMGMIISALGGRAAEQVIYGVGEVSTGSSDDIEKATSIARAMVTRFGMSILGPIAYERNTGPQYLGNNNEVQRDYSDSLAERIDEAIRDIILKAELEAIVIIKKNKKLLGLIVDELIEKETIVVEEIDYINKYLKRPPAKKTKTVKTKENNSLSSLIDDVEQPKKKPKSMSNAKTKSKKTENK